MHNIADVSEKNSSEYIRKELPDLGALFDKEQHVTLLFDNGRDGRCLLAVGAQKSLTLGSEHPNALEAVDGFISRARQHQSWAFGWLGYDLKNTVEELESQRPDRTEFPVLHWVQPHMVFEWSAHSMPKLIYGPLEEKAVEILAALKRPTAQAVSAGEKFNLKPRWDRATYLQRVQRVKKHIQRGDVYELNLCQEWFGDGRLADPWNAFVRLQKFTQAPYSAFVKSGAFQLLCASPELFLSQRGKTLTSSPIKGTIRRGATADEDERLKEQLRNDPKERGENVMICDLVRNDLSRIATNGSVEVSELFSVDTYRTVHQMISTVKCQITDDITIADILRATFPMGSMTGAPKIRAMQLIDELEGTRRGIYSGSVGCFSPNGDFDLNVVIRSIACNTASQTLSVQVGGAITHLSDPEREYEECLLKADALLQTLNGDG